MGTNATVGSTCAGSASGCWWLAVWIAEDKVREDLGRKLRIGDIGFNPCTFALEVTDFALADPDCHKLAAFEPLFVNFTLARLIDQA